MRNESSHVSDFSDPDGLREDDERSRAPSWSVRRQHGTSHIVGCLFTGDDAVPDEAVSTLKANPNVTVNANGYCDAIGGENENCEIVLELFLRNILLLAWTAYSLPNNAERGRGGLELWDPSNILLQQSLSIGAPI